MSYTLVVQLLFVQKVIRHFGEKKCQINQFLIIVHTNLPGSNEIHHQ